MGTTFTEQVGLLLGQATRTVYRFDRDIVHPNAYAGAVGPNTYVAPEGKVEIISEPALLLERLYAGASPEDRATFVLALFGALNAQSARVVARTLAATHNLAPLAVTRKLRSGEELWRGLVHTLRFESGLFSEKDLQTVLAAARPAKEVARPLAVTRKLRSGEELWRGLVHTLRFESGLFSEKDLQTVLAAARPAKEVARPFAVERSNVSGRLHPGRAYWPEVRSVVERIRYLRLAKNIREGRNPAVDTDRQVLLSRLQAMGFSDSLSIASNEIEHRAGIASTATDVKTVMDLLRSFYEGFIKEACGKIEMRVGKSVPSGSFQPHKQYLENAGLLVPDESAVLQSLYNFLSNQGAHKLSSAPEQLRVAHATIIEWCMLVAGRIDAFSASP